MTEIIQDEVPFEVEFPEAGAALANLYATGQLSRAKMRAGIHSRLWDIKPDFRGTGRNDPCPCGSGKKFKKCCQ